MTNTTPTNANTEQSEKQRATQFSVAVDIRDYFAAKAMQAQVMTDMVPGEACDALLEAAERAGQDPVYRLALASYEIADAMMEARDA